jgi:hypothetical protein
MIGRLLDRLVELLGGVAVDLADQHLRVDAGLLADLRGGLSGDAREVAREEAADPVALGVLQHLEQHASSMP